MARTLTIALVALFFVAFLTAAASAATTEGEAPATTTESTTSRPHNATGMRGSTEAILLNDVNVVPIIAGTGGLLVLLSVVAVRRDWLT